MIWPSLRSVDSACPTTTWYERTASSSSWEMVVRSMPAASNAAFVGAKTVIAVPPVRVDGDNADCTAADARPTASTRVLKSAVAAATSRVVGGHDDRVHQMNPAVAGQHV